MDVVCAAVYARISSDNDGKGLGVGRQLEDCRKLAADRGWTIAQEYVDNDVSAFSGKVRPAYERMVADLRAGVRDAVIVYNLDRLHRRPVELEEFVLLCEQVGVRNVATVTADIDLGNDDGLFMARIFAAFAAKESGRRSARVRRKMDANAAAGLPHGSARPFGYEADQITVRESEAVIVRDLVARYLAGESLRGLATSLQAAGVPTVTGRGGWLSPTVAGILASPRIAGLRSHNGVIVADAVWPALITREDHARVLARMQTRAVSGRRAPRTHLLSGLLRCGKCGGTLFSSCRYNADGTSRLRYVCSKGPDHHGCGGVTVTGSPLEALLTEAVLIRVDSPELADKVAGRTSDNATVTALADSIERDQAQLDELAGLYAQGAISAREWIAARDPIDARVRDSQRQLATATDMGPLGALAGTGQGLRAQWDTLTLDRRHAIIKSVLDHATIGPGTQGSRSLDPARVQPFWKL